MSEINENLEVNETVENSAVESAVPEVKEVVEQPEAVVEEPVVAEEVAEEVQEEVVVVAETKAVVGKPVVVEKVASAVADEEFDWDAFEGKKPMSGSTSKQSMTEMYDNTLSILQEKECVDGIVISMNKREVVVNIG